MPKRKKNTESKKEIDDLLIKESSWQLLSGLYLTNRVRHPCRLDEEDGELKEENKNKCHTLLDMFDHMENSIESFLEVWLSIWE